MRAESVSRIKWNTDVDAPGCPGEIVEVRRGDQRQCRRILIQTDYDYPGVADSFGWDIRGVQRSGHHCDHHGTDGTIDCPYCPVTASEFIQAAGDWLAEHDGVRAEDPGYFDD